MNMKIKIKYSIIGEFLKIIERGKNKRRWHKMHPDSDTIPMNKFDFNHVSIGKGTYGELNVVDYGGTSRLIIKNYVSIAQNVYFLLNAEHYTNHISTYPFKTKLLGVVKQESFGKGDILVDDDVWIGFGALIMSGIHIGKGAIIGAGAVVTRNVPPYSIVGGNPARVIRYRLTEDIMEVAQRLDYEKITYESISKHIDLFYNEITVDEIKTVVNGINGNE